MLSNTIILNASSDKFVNAIKTATDGTTDVLINLLISVASPIVMILSGAFLFILIVKAGFTADKMKGQIQEHLFQIILLAIAFLASASVTTWISFFK